jgi:hypothetical protein
MTSIESVNLMIHERISKIQQIIKENKKSYTDYYYNCNYYLHMATLHGYSIYLCVVQAFLPYKNTDTLIRVNKKINNMVNP